MSTKVKRGLGLLVVAALVWIATFFVGRGDQNGAAVSLALLVLTLALFASFVGGLVLIAWGLLRD